MYLMSTKMLLIII